MLVGINRALGAYPPKWSGRAEKLMGYHVEELKANDIPAV